MRMRMWGTSEHPRVRLVVELIVALAGASLLVWASRMDTRWLELHATQAFCFERPGQVTYTRFKVALVVAVGAALLLVVRPLVGRWAGRRTARAVLGDLARLVVVPTILALLVCEAVLRLRAAPPLDHFEPDSERDARLSWRPVPSHVTDVRVGDRTVRFVIDADDERVRSLDEPLDPSRPTIIFTGESIASGWGLPYDETHPAMVGARLHVQAVNMGVQGYANDAAYLRLTDALPRFSHVLATVTLVLPAMLDRNMAPDRPHLLFEPDGSSITEPRFDEGWRALLVWGVIERAVGVHSTEAVKRAHDVLAATARASRARGALPLAVVFGWPTCLPDDAGSPAVDRILFDGLDMPYVHADVPKDQWDPVIGHPNARGQAMIADVVVRALAAHGVGGATGLAQATATER